MTTEAPSTSALASAQSPVAGGRRRAGCRRIVAGCLGAEQRSGQCRGAAGEGDARYRRRLPAERDAMGEPAARAGAPGLVPRRARDRRQDRDQRGHHHAGLLALLRPGHPPDRQARRSSSSAAPRCSRSRRASSCRARTISSPPSPASTRRSRGWRSRRPVEKRQSELLAIRGGALKDLEQAQSDLVGAQGDLRSAEIALAAVAQPAAHPRPLRRGDRASSRRSTASAPRRSSPRRSAAR